MNDLANLKPPAALAEILKETQASGFNRASEVQTDSLLRTLAASKPGGNFLEIGTGTGVGACWILDGMDEKANLTTIEKEAEHNAIARKFLGSDKRVKFLTGDATEFLKDFESEQFDFIFADSWPGKFSSLEEALRSLKVGGLYIIDDLLPQANWPENHEASVKELIANLESRPNLRLTKLAWASGLIIATKV